MTTPIPNRIARSCLAAATVFSCSLPLTAQEDEGEIFTLSPFTVDGSEDEGYRANSTLAGSRMRTNLSDVPNAISVFTEELMQDLGATSEEDLLRYSSSAVEELTDQASGVQGISLFEGYFRSRIRGQVATRARNYFETVLLPDTYNSERFEEARGPNAILFGLGGSGGLLNTSTKRAAISEDFTKLAFRADNFDTFRFSLDHNQVVNEKFAIRLNTLFQDGGGWRTGDVDDATRYHLAATFQPLEKMTVRAEYEKGEMTNTVTRGFAPQDFVSIWVENGSQTVPNATAGQNINQGTGRQNANQRVTYIANNGNTTNFQQTVFTNHNAATGRHRGFLSPELWAELEPGTPYPFEASFFGPGAVVENDQELAALTVEFEPVDNLYIELAAVDETRIHDIFDYNIEVQNLRADPIENYRDGSANPYSGDYYIESFPILRHSDVNVKRYRGTAAYTLDLERAGKHNFAALWSRDDSVNPRNTDFLVVEGSPFNANPAHIRNRVRMRQYIENPADLNQWMLPSWQTIPSSVTIQNDTGPAAGQTYSVGWATNAANEPISLIDSYMATLQSYWLKDRLITTLGWRGVDYEQTRGESLDIGDLERWSYGFVAKPTEKVSLYYNFSENAVLPTSVQTLVPDESLFPINGGEGKDYGLMLSLFEDKVFVRAGFFESSSVDQAKAAGVGGLIRNRHERITDALVDANLLTVGSFPTVEGGDFDLADVTTEGIELNGTANLTKNWRLMLNLSESESTDSDLLKVSEPLLEELLPIWRTSGGADLVTSNGITIAEEIQDALDTRDGFVALEGDSTVGHRETSIRLFTRYDFRDSLGGRFKGMFVGGGLSYGSSPVIGKDTGTDEFIEGGSHTEADLLFGYRKKLDNFLGGPKTLIVQLNARNVLQDGDLRPIRAESDGQLFRARFLPPTQYLLTTRLEF